MNYLLRMCMGLCIVGTACAKDTQAPPAGRDAVHHARYANGAREYEVLFFSGRGEYCTQPVVRRGRLHIVPNARATVLLCHGFMCSKDDISFLRTYLFQGYNTMIFDFRAHGDLADGQCCTFGRDEVCDVVGAARFVRTHPEVGSKPLIVYGFSMGAVASILAQARHPELFNAAIWDCPFDSTEALIARSIENLRISLLGYQFKLPGVEFLKRYAYHPIVQSIIKGALKTIAQVDATQVPTVMQPVRPNQEIKKVTIPALFIVCENDDKAPPAAVRDIYTNAGSVYKRLWITPGRRHFDSMFNYPEKYAYKIRTFIEQVLSGAYTKKQPAKIHDSTATPAHLEPKKGL